MPDRTQKQDAPDDRARDILRLIVRTYIRSGEPVGSQTLSRLMQRTLSSASIRNIMADLETAGYLTHPHTSAGRVPTELGYRVYVDGLGAAPKPTRSDEAYIDDQLARADTAEELMSTACHLLSDISQNVGIVVSPPMEISVLKHIEFIRVDDSKILVIFVSQSGMLQKKLIRVREPYTQEELTRAGNYLVERFAGRTLPDVRRELLDLMNEERVMYDRMVRKLIRYWSDSLESPTDATGDSVYIHGTGNILAHMDVSEIAQLQELFRLFEEKERLIEILNECLPSDAGQSDRVQIMIGSEFGAPVMRGLTVISSPYSQREGGTGFVGIIGPTRMQYRQGISVVSYLADAFGRRMGA